MFLFFYWSINRFPKIIEFFFKRFLEKDTEQNNYYEFLKQKLCKQKNISQVNQNNDVDSSTPTISEPYENLVKLFQGFFFTTKYDLIQSWLFVYEIVI